MSLQHDITIKQGKDFEYEYTVLEEDGSEIADFQASQFRGQVRSNYGELIATFTVVPTGPRTCVAKLTNAVTALIPATSVFKHKHDSEFQTPQGKVREIAFGRVMIQGEQTK